MNNKLQGILKNFSYTFAANLISTFISILLVAVVPKLLGTGEYGYWQLYVFYTSYVGFFHLGWADGIYLRYGGKQYESLDKKLFHSQFWMIFIFEAAVSVGIGALALTSTDPNKGKIFLMTGVCCVLLLPRTLLQYLLQGTNRIREYARNVMAEKILYALLVGLFLLMGTRDFSSLLWADIIAKLAALGGICYTCRDIVFARRAPLKKGFGEAWHNVRVGCKLMFANVAGMLIIGVVRFAIEQNWDVEVFGKVSLTLSVSNLLMVFISAVSVVIYPVLRRTDSSRWAEKYSLLRNMLVMPLLALLMLYYPARVILSAWLPQYAESLHFMALMFPVCIYESIMTMLVGTYLKALRRENWMLMVNLASVALSVVSTAVIVFWVHDLNLAVASIVMLLAFRTVLAELLLTKSMKLHMGKDILLELCMTALFIVLSWFVGGWIGALGYAAVYAGYLLIKKKDAKQVIAGVRGQLKG